ncbi:MAG: histidine--tRNA ligase [Alphaproteobacteria bacterium]|nr:histidine--tRNA ligase [Alphaproteobacteria bacterium]
MDLKPTKPLSGFIELLPVQQRCFDECARRMQEVLKTAGFTRLDLPAIERAEVLTDKDNWDEIETQMFLFQKGDTKMGLRYDGTVGLARYVSGHLSDLVFPFRATQLNRVYRGERPQKGRYRELYQMDLDILGIGGLSNNYDAEIISTISRTFESVKEFIGPVTICIGSRPFWNALSDILGLDTCVRNQLFIWIDKRAKMDEKDFEIGLKDIVGEKDTIEILKVFTTGYKSFLNQSANLDSAISEIMEFESLLTAMGVKNAKIDLSIMRGLAYYTGLVYETYLNNYPDFGSVCGGGRYGELASKFSKTSIIGAGAAIGISRMLVALMDDNRIDLTRFENPVDVSVLVMGQAQVAFAMSVLTALREAGIVAVPYLDADRKFKNQMEYADKIKSRFSIIIGEDEVKSGMLTVKNMATGEQVKTDLNDWIASLCSQ